LTLAPELGDWVTTGAREPHSITWRLMILGWSSSKIWALGWNFALFEVMKRMRELAFREPGMGLFDGVAIGDAVNGDHAADCARKKGGHDARPGVCNGGGPLQMALHLIQFE